MSRILFGLSIAIFVMALFTLDTIDLGWLLPYILMTIAYLIKEIA